MLKSYFRNDKQRNKLLLSYSKVSVTIFSLNYGSNDRLCREEISRQEI